MSRISIYRYDIYHDGPEESQRNNHVITVSVPVQDNRRQHRFSPHENAPVSTTGAPRFQQASPTGTATAEEYEQQTVDKSGQLGSPAPVTYSPNRTTHHSLVSNYSTSEAGIKYDISAAAAAAASESLKTSSTYTTLETVAPLPSQAVQYHQYISDNYQHAPSYNYSKSSEVTYLAYQGVPPTSRGVEVNLFYYLTFNLLDI